MITLYGVTEDGTSVPVQVTDDGKLIVHKDESFEPGDDIVAGDIECGSITAGDITADSATVTGQVYAGSSETSDSTTLAAVNQSSTNPTLFLRNRDTSAGSRLIQGKQGTTNTTTFEVYSNGTITVAGDVNVGDFSAGNGLRTFSSGAIYLNDSSNSTSDVFRIYKGSDINIELKNTGEAEFAGGKCGFTSDGEVYFTSRSTRYKLEVAGGLCNAIPYTRATELQEKAEQLRQPKTQDIVPED